jgi:hypothetical protein
MVAGHAALHEAPSSCLLLVFHRLPLLMQPMRVCSSGGRVLINLPLFLIETQHLCGRLLQRSDAAAGLPLRAARRALASQVPLQPECGALPCCYDLQSTLFSIGLLLDPGAVGLCT